MKSFQKEGEIFDFLQFFFQKFNKSLSVNMCQALFHSAIWRLDHLDKSWVSRSESGRKWDWKDGLDQVVHGLVGQTGQKAWTPSCKFWSVWGDPYEEKL